MAAPTEQPPDHKKSPTAHAAGLLFTTPGKGSGAVIHVEFDRRRGHFPTIDFGPFQFDIGFDLILGEDIALEQEFVIGFQAGQRLAQRCADGWHLAQLFWRQVIEILVHRGARMEFVLDTVEARHQQRGVAQIRVRHRVGEAELHALSLGARAIGNTAGGRTVARRIGEQHRRFEARHQALVAVGGRVGEGIERLGMLDDAADEVEAGLAEARIAVAREQRLAAFPDRHMRVHAAAIVLRDRLGHEGRRLAIGLRHHLHDVLVDLHAVGGLDQRTERQAQLVLRGGDFVVVLIAGQAHFQHGADHFGADVGARIDRRDGEITTLGARTVAQIAAFIFLAGVGRQFDVVDLEIALRVIIFETHIVEHEEFGFRPDIDRVAEPGRLDEGFRALGGRTRIAAVQLTGVRLDNVAENDQHGRRAERVDIDSVQVGLEDHVRFVDRLPTLDRRTVEHQAVGQFILAKHARHHGQVLPLALGIGEADIDPFDLLFLDHLQDVFWRVGHMRLPFFQKNPPRRGLLMPGRPVRAGTGRNIRSRRYRARRYGCAPRLRCWK
ncbi:hypothetical protein SKA58_08424 [Sphingomonas sp. SKA58]|nr:hypothetical protein SKA58_08424 [Sphingomonas sp. SKA58]